LLRKTKNPKERVEVFDDLPVENTNYTKIQLYHKFIKVIAKEYIKSK
jgi:hypothetical protein